MPISNKPVLSKYFIKLYFIDHENVVMDTAEFKNNTPITEDAMVQILHDKIKLLVTKGTRYAFTVQKNGPVGPFIGRGFLKKLKELQRGTTKTTKQ